MTQQTSIADIVKPLEWTHYDDDFSEACFYIGSKTVYQAKFDEKNRCFVALKNKFPLVQKRLATGNTKIAMMKVCQQDYEAYVLENLDLTKLQPQPEGFWKPIEQCPKVPEILYLIKWDMKIFAAEWEDDTWYDSDGAVVPYGNHATHFAEIPVCKVKS